MINYSIGFKRYRNELRKKLFVRIYVALLKSKYIEIIWENKVRKKKNEETNENVWNICM